MTRYEEYINRLCRTGRYTPEQAKEFAISKAVKEYYESEGDTDATVQHEFVCTSEDRRIYILKTFLIVAGIYFLILYFVAFLSNRHNRDKDDVLWISRNQWRALFIMWVPIIVFLLRD